MDGYLSIKKDGGEFSRIGSWTALIIFTVLLITPAIIFANEDDASVSSSTSSFSEKDVTGASMNGKKIIIDSQIPVLTGKINSKKKVTENDLQEALKGYNHIIVSNKDQLNVKVTSAVSENIEKRVGVIIKQNKDRKHFVRVPAAADPYSHKPSERRFSPMEPISPAQTVNPEISFDNEQLSPAEMPDKGGHSDLSPTATALRDGEPSAFPDEWIASSSSMPPD